MRRVAVLCLVLGACGFPRPARVTGDGGGDGGGDAPVSSCTTCALFAVHPAIANTGDTITLEGVFAGNAGDAITVNFPGGAPQTGMLLGADRATVTVPAGSTTGDLTVEIGGGPIGPVKFRRATFVPGLQQFMPGDQTTGARFDNVPLAERDAPQAVVTDHFVYVLGGITSGSTVSTIEVARLDADGSVGEFGVAGDPLLVPRQAFTADIIGKYVYVLGGQNSTGNLTEVERAPIAADGSVGAFVSAGVNLALPRSGHATAVIGNNLYVFGGFGNGSEGNSVESATIQPDGSLGPFAIVPGVSTGTSRVHTTSAVIGKFVYLIGGGDAASMAPIDTIEAAPINPDGTLGTFTVVSARLTVPRFGPVARVLGGHLYVIGGFTGTANVASIDVATIGADGTLGNIALSPMSLRVARSDAASAIIGNFLYVFGSAPPTTPGAIERASIDSSGVTGTFSIAATKLSVARGEETAAAIGGYLYVFGGADATNMPIGSVERAPLAADGSVGTFAVVSGVTLATPRFAQTAAVLGGYVYMIGGDVVGGVTGNVERAQILNDGSLGNFADTNRPLLYALDWHATAASSNTLYVMGGRPGGGTTTEIEQASITADGTLGTFSAATAVTATSRYFPTIAVIGKYMYLIGGEDGTNGGAVATVERATINADGTLTSFQIVSGVTLVTPRMQQSSAVIGSSLYVFGGYDTGPLTSVERATINPDGTISTFSTVTGVTLARLRLDAPVVVSGNSLYVVGSYDGGASMDIEQATLQ